MFSSVWNEVFDKTKGTVMQITTKKLFIKKPLPKSFVIFNKSEQNFIVT